MGLSYIVYHFNNDTHFSDLAKRSLKTIRGWQFSKPIENKIHGSENNEEAVEFLEVY